MYSLSTQASKLLTYDVVQSTVPAEGTYSNATVRKMAVLQVVLKANKKAPEAGDLRTGRVKRQVAGNSVQEVQNGGLHEQNF